MSRLTIGQVMSLRSGASRLRSRSLSSLVPDPRPRSEWTLLGLFGLTLTAAVFAIVGGLLGGLLALAFGVLWLFVPTVYSYAVGHLFALGVSAQALSAVELLFIEMGLVAVLLGPLVASTIENEDENNLRSLRSRSVIGAGSALFAVVVVGLALVEMLWVNAVVLLAIGVLVAYGLHRYERVSLGLADEEGSVE